MSTAAKFIKSSAIYFIGNVLTKIISFFLLPIYTHFLPPEDLGYYDLALRYINILIPIISIEIWVGIMRFMFDHEEINSKYKIILNGFVIVSAGIVAYSLIMLLCGTIYDIKYILLIYIYGIVFFVQNVYSYIIRGMGHSKTFVVSGIVGGLINAASNIILIIFLKRRADSLFISVALGLLMQIIIMESKTKILKNISLKMIDKKIIASLIKFSMPLCLNSICFWFISNYNSIGVSNILGIGANGIYSAAGKISVVIGVASSCFTTAWQELVFSKGGGDEHKSVLYSKSTVYQIKFMLILVAGLLPAVNILFPYFIGQNYSEAFDLIPFCLLATSASIFSNFLGHIFLGEKNTKIVLYTTVIAASVNMIMFHSLIGIFGLNIASISMLCGFLVDIIIRIIILKRSFKIKINFISLIFPAFLLTVSFISYFYGGTVINLITGILIALSGIIIFKDILKPILLEAKKYIKKPN